MARVITGLDNIPISAASAAYAPTNTADVTAMIDSAVSGKLDASASSSFQPVGNYVSSSDLSGYLPTSSIGVDSASAVTSIAGSSIASGEQVVTSITTGGYGVSAINGTVINASHMKLGAAAADNDSNIVRLGDESYGAGVFLTGNFGTAYYKVNELQLNRNGTGFIGFNIGIAGSTITATSNVGGKFSAGGTGGSRSYYTAYNGSASASIEVTADSAKINLADSGYTSTIYPSSIPYWNAKLDSSSIETSVDGITGIGGTAIAGGGGTTYTAGQYIQISDDEISVTGLQPSGDYVSSSELTDYQPTSSMSAYATTGDLSAKLDASASSSFVTSTADCMPLSASSDYYSTSNPAGYITGVDLTPYQTTAGMSAYLPTSAIGVDTASSLITGINGSALSAGSTYSAGQYVQISGDEISVTGLQPSGDYVSSSDMSAYQPTSSMSAYATTDDLSAKLDASASSSFITSTAGLATTGDLTAKLDVSATSSFITSTADCMPLSYSSDYYSTSNPAGYITGVDLTPYQTTAGMSAYLPTSAIHSDSAGITSIGGTAVGGKDYTAGTGIDITNNVVSVDTSVVATQTDLASKQDTLTAGTNVSITNNVISATDTTYSAGTGIDITDDVISVEAPVDIVAGPGIVIDNPDGNTLRVSQQYPTDETVLWSGTVGSTGAAKNLSESAENFETIRVYTQVSTGTTERCIQMFDMQLKFSSTQGLAFVHVDNISGGNLLSEIIYLKFNRAANTFELLAGCKWSNNTFSQNISSYDFNVVKVSGIHRIANN